MNEIKKIDFKKMVADEFDMIKAAMNGNADSEINIMKKEAIKVFSEMGLPTPKHEEWKYTSLNFLRKNDFTIPSFDDIDKIIIDKSDRLPDIENAVKIYIVNGYVQEDGSELLNNENITIKPIRNTVDEEIIPVKDMITSGDYRKNPFLAVNSGLASDGLLIKLARNYSFSRPVHIINLSDTNNGNVFSNTMNFIQAGENSSINIVISDLSLGSNMSFTNTATYGSLSAGSSVKYYAVRNDREGSYSINDLILDQHRDSSFKNYTVSIDGSFVRNNLKTTLLGSGADADMKGVFITTDERFVENHILIDHKSPDCTSNQLFKGILDDKSRAVFNGKILVRPDAQRTNAYQTNRNILLTDDAKINTKPQLEIYADDVKCSHGATTGSLDDEAIFYFRARGIDEDAARSLLLKAFADEIVEEIEIEGLKKFLLEKIDDILNF